MKRKRRRGNLPEEHPASQLMEAILGEGDLMSLKDDIKAGRKAALNNTLLRAEHALYSAIDILAVLPDYSDCGDGLKDALSKVRKVLEVLKA